MTKKFFFSAIKKTTLALPYIFVFSLSSIFLSHQQDQSIQMVLWDSIFGQISAGNIETLVVSIKILGLIFLFSLLFGDYLSRYLGSVGSFVFVRISSRLQWSLRKIVNLYGLSALYTAILIGTELLISFRKVIRPSLDESTCMVLLILFAILSTIFVSVCLIVNYLSIRHGISVSLVITFLIVLILQVVSILFYDVSANVLFNPFSFNSKIVDSLDYALIKIGIEFVYMGGISCVLVRRINKADIV